MGEHPNGAPIEVHAGPRAYPSVHIVKITAQEQQAILERRRKVAALRLAGLRDQRQIADQLGVHQSTISRDCKALDAEYQRQAAADIATEKGIELARCERLIQAHWRDALAGKWLATDRVLAVMQHKAKILGLEAPTKIDITHEVRQAAIELGLDPDEAVRIADDYVRSLNVGAS